MAAPTLHINRAHNQSDDERDDNGGIMGDIKRLRKKVNANTIWRLRITAAGTVVIGIVSFVLAKFGSLLGTIRDLVTPN